jgi:hypothetical protein
MSVDLERQIEEAGFDPRQYVTNPRFTGSIRFEAGSLRDNGFQVGFNPITEGSDPNPYHGEVWFQHSKATERTLRGLCIWFVELEGVSIAA